MNNGHNRMYGYADDNFVRYNLSGGKEVRTREEHPEYFGDSEFISEVDAAYANGVFKGYTTEKAVKESIINDLKNWKATPETNPELFDYLNN